MQTTNLFIVSQPIRLFVSPNKLPTCRSKTPLRPARRPRCSAPTPTPSPRQTDPRGFLVPEAGDVVVYSGRWADEDAVGLVQSVLYNESRCTHTVDVAELRRIGADMFAIRSSSRSSKRWFDSAELRVITNATYVPEQDAYIVTGTNDGYAKVAPLDDDAKRIADAEYQTLKTDMLRTTLLTAAAGTLISAVVFGPSVGQSFAYGGAASALYLAMLQANVDTMGTSSFAARLLGLRFALPALPFILLAAPSVYAHGMSALLGSVSKPQTLAAVLGLLCYKVPLLARTAGEFVDGLADVQMGTTGMVGTVASLAARQIKKQRDGEVEQVDVPAPSLLFVFAGPSGVGKSSLIQKLFDDYPSRFGYSISHTTRAPREGEEDGVEYNFVDVKTFQSMIQNDEFVEYAEVHGQYYGTSYASMKDVASSGRVCILDLDIHGIEALRNKDGTDWQPRFLWIAPPSMSALEERLRGRGTESEETLKKRLNTAKEELIYAATNNVFDLTVINKDLDEAYAEVEAYVALQIGEDA